MPVSPVPAVSRTFPPEAASVPAARRFVRDAVLLAGQEQWVDEAQLAASEAATNAVLHAHTPFEVTVRAGSDGVYVQVWDDDAALPARRTSGATSTTGRGMELIAGVTSAHGVETVGPTKVVWFCLGMPEPDSADVLLLDRWQGRHQDDTVAASPGQARTVVLAGMPLSLWLAAREHHNGLMREYSLHEQAAQDRPGQIPAELVAADRARSLVLDAVRASPAERTLDLVLQVRPEQAEWFRALRDVLDRAEALATAGELLSSPGPGAVVDVRRWACTEVLAQLDGATPVRWTGPLELAR